MQKLYLILLLLLPTVSYATYEANVSYEGWVTKDGRFSGNPGSVYLSPVVIKYSGDAGDPAGDWLIETVLTDRNRDARVVLTSKFTLINKVGN